ncbi:MAG: sigma factor G inhibitor Gin [Bacteroidota bacterium]
MCGRPGTDGPVILGKRLCAACERAIVDLDVGGRDYDFFVARIREAWRSFAGVEQ